MHVPMCIRGCQTVMTETNKTTNFRVILATVCYHCIGTVLNSTKHKHTLTESYMVPWWSNNFTIIYNATKDHTAMLKT